MKNDGIILPPDPEPNPPPLGVSPSLSLLLEPKPPPRPPPNPPRLEPKPPLLLPNPPSLVPKNQAHLLFLFFPFQIDRQDTDKHIKQKKVLINSLRPLTDLVN